MMDQATPDLVLDAVPDAAIIQQMRQQAQDRGASVIAALELATGDSYHLVISARGTCVLLQGGTSVETVNASKEPEAVVAALQAAAQGG